MPVHVHARACANTYVSVCAHVCACLHCVCTHTHTCRSTLVQGSQQEEGSAFNHGMCRAVGQGLGLGEECLPGGEPMARTEPHGGQGRASEKGQAGRRPAPHWVQVTGAVAPPGWLTPAPLGHTQRPGLRWGSNSTSLATTGEGPGGGSWPRGRGPARLRVTPLQRCSRGDCLPGAAGPLSGPWVPISQPGSLRRPSPPAHLGVPRTVAN